MILNAYAVLDGFVVLLRGCVALLVIGLGCAAWRDHRLSHARADVLPSAESRCYLLFLLAFLLLGLNLVSWPLLYFLLESYVPQWPGVMCIYGVTQIGAGSMGASRFLPGLVAGLQCLKPAVVFLSGVWLVLYRINRRTRTAPLMQRVILVQIALGLLVLADTVVEAAYLAIPKKEEFLSTGCCTAAMIEPSRRSTIAIEFLSGETRRALLSAAYYTVNLGMVLALGTSLRRGRRLSATPPVAFLLLGASVAVPITAVFLVEVAAPAVLHLPYHHCLYDLIPKAPDMVFGIGLFVWGSFCVGWACMAKWLANCPETQEFVQTEQNRILSLGLNCYWGSLIVTSLELILS